MAALILMAVLDTASWAYLYQRGPASSPYVSRVSSTGLSPLTEPPGGSPTPPATLPGAAPLPLPRVAGRALNVSIVADTLGIGRYSSGPRKRYRALVLSALAAQGPVNAEEASVWDGSGLATNVTVPGDLDLVVLELGTDDMVRTDVAGFASAYGTLARSVRASSPTAELICPGTWSNGGGAYDAVIQRDCEAARGRFVSLRNLYAAAAYRGPAGVSGFYGVSDNAAPNDAGHLAIAAALLGAIRQGVS